MEGIYTAADLEELIAGEKGVLLYFSNHMCSVCRVLKPKVLELLQEKFPLMAARYIDIDKSPVLSGQHRVFTIPTILLFFDGKENQRFSRNISLGQLEEAISRPYSLLFD